MYASQKKLKLINLHIKTPFLFSLLSWNHRLVLGQVTTLVFTLSLQDHDFAVVRQEVSVEKMLRAAKEEIKRLQQELDRKKYI